MRTKTLYRCDAQKIDISRFPNFHITGSITGMKKLYYGKNALLVRCGSWIYNVSSEPEVYYMFILFYSLIIALLSARWRCGKFPSVWDKTLPAIHPSRCCRE